MTVYECDLAILEQRQSELANNAERARVAAAAGGPLRLTVATLLRAAADRIEPGPSPARRSFQL